MLSINHQKLIRSLHQKKYRDENSMFLIEGEKMINDLLKSNELNASNIVLLCSTEDWLQNHAEIPKEIKEKLSIVDYVTIRKISSLVSPQDVLALVKIPENVYNNKFLKEGYTLVFDAIRDPGNLGTIIRTADWFGIENIICSPDSVDQFNSKVVQSSMGAILRVNLFYENLEKVFIDATRMKVPIYGTTMGGDDFFDIPLKNPGIIVFGNESAGIRNELIPNFKEQICIPDFPRGKSKSESLNVATSVAVICSEIRRRER